MDKNKKEQKPQTDDLSGSNPGDESDDCEKVCHMDQLIPNFNKTFVYQTYIAGPVNPAFRDAITEVIGYKAIRGIRLRINTATSEDTSTSQFDCKYSLDNIKNIIKIDTWKSGYYKVAYKACCLYQDSLSDNDDGDENIVFKQPEFLLVATTSSFEEKCYKIRLEIFSSSNENDNLSIDRYLKFLLNDDEFLSSLCLGHKFYFYNSHDSNIIKNITSTNSNRVTMVRDGGSSCTIS
jgi:hypothetical protein